MSIKLKDIGLNFIKTGEKDNVNLYDVNVKRAKATPQKFRYASKLEPDNPGLPHSFLHSVGRELETILHIDETEWKQHKKNTAYSATLAQCEKWSILLGGEIRHFLSSLFGAPYNPYIGFEILETPENEHWLYVFYRGRFASMSRYDGGPFFGKLVEFVEGIDPHGNAGIVPKGISACLTTARFENGTDLPSFSGNCVQENYFRQRKNGARLYIDDEHCAEERIFGELCRIKF